MANETEKKAYDPEYNAWDKLRMGTGAAIGGLTHGVAGVPVGVGAGLMSAYGAHLPYVGAPFRFANQFLTPTQVGIGAGLTAALPLSLYGAGQGAHRWDPATKIGSYEDPTLWDSTRAGIGSALGTSAGTALGAVGGVTPGAASGALIGSALGALAGNPARGLVYGSVLGGMGGSLLGGTLGGLYGAGRGAILFGPQTDAALQQKQSSINGGNTNMNPFQKRADEGIPGGAPGGAPPALPPEVAAAIQQDPGFFARQMQHLRDAGSWGYNHLPDASMANAATAGSALGGAALGALAGGKGNRALGGLAGAGLGTAARFGGPMAYNHFFGGAPAAPAAPAVPPEMMVPPEMKAAAENFLAQNGATAVDVAKIAGALVALGEVNCTTKEAAELLGVHENVVEAVMAVTA